jgi:hypothetical protein
MKWVTKVKPNINSGKVHPQLGKNWHPMDGGLVVGCWFTMAPWIDKIKRGLGIQIQHFWGA